jgi:glycosyltransferase involved in cell wall biosynthesis
VTGEYPPQPGGVSDYTRLVAQGLASSGDEVCVWTSPAQGETPTDPGVRVVRLPDRFGPRGLAVLDAELRSEWRCSRVLVQYVPHMYGCRAMNVAFCSWLAIRARRMSVMFHEVAFPMGRRQKLTHNILGGITHAMAALVARAAERIFVSVPSWGELLRRRLRVRRPVCWLPVPANVPTIVDGDAVSRLRARLLPRRDGTLIGHFGTFHPAATPLLADVLTRLLWKHDGRSAVLVGRGSDRFVADLAKRSPELRDRLAARADIPATDVAEHLAACDFLMQPYLDGVSSRRSTAMAGLGLGVPIVSNEGAATEPLWCGEGLAQLVPGFDAVRLAETAEAILDDPPAREALSRRGRAGYERHFSLSCTLDRLRTYVQ